MAGVVRAQRLARPRSGPLKGRQVRRSQPLGDDAVPRAVLAAASRTQGSGLRDPRPLAKVGLRAGYGAELV